MSIDVAYPYDAASYDPRPLAAREIWSVADQVRRRLTPRPQMPCLDLGRLTRSGQKLRVNGVEYVTHLDFERTVHDGRGREALGVTEADPAVPGAVLISLNGAVIGDRDYLKRSTLAHELGHALFDGPSMIRLAGKPAFALVTPNEQHLGSTRRSKAGPDWREFRANEFMGALLVPRELLHRELVRRSISLGLTLRDRGGSEPVLDKFFDLARFDQLLIELGERFGVSAEFIECRLKRYCLVR